jgi:hypothetical protein
LGLRDSCNKNSKGFKGCSDSRKKNKETERLCCVERERERERDVYYASYDQNKQYKEKK